MLKKEHIVEASINELQSVLGVNRKEIKRAIEELNRKGFIDILKINGKTYYRLRKYVDWL